jgi:hypothetical protein
MSRKSISPILFNVILGGISAAAMVRADSLVLVTSVGAQNATDTAKWSQLGPDNSVLAQAVSIKSGKGTVYLVSLAGANSVTSVVCSTNPCSWIGNGFPAADTVLWTSDAGAGGNGPVTVKFPSGVAGAGALIQADTPGKFTAEIQAYNGTTLLGTFTAISNSNGDATYIGVNDQTGSNITSIVLSLTSCSGLCTDFAVDTLNINQPPPAPVVKLTSTSLTFGSQLVGTSSAAQAVTLSNTGNAALSISSILPSGDFSETNTCGTSVAAGGSCSISVTFKPTATGTRTGSVKITDNAAGSPQSISLTGKGIAPSVTLTPTSLTFPAQLLNTASATQSVVMKNTGTAALTISGIVPSGDFTETNNCGTSLAAAASCSITVTFKPTAINTRTGSVKVTDNATGSPQTVTLTGTGTEVKLSATSLVFPATKVGVTSAAQTVTMTNTGTAAFSITSISVTGANPGDFLESNNCSTSLGAGKSCTLTVNFKPKATGSRKASISISDAGGGSPQTVALSGTGQ